MAAADQSAVAAAAVAAEPARIARHGAVYLTQQAENQFQLRLLLAFAAMLLGFVILAARFAWLQVSARTLRHLAQKDNSITLSPIIPTAADCDRNGVVLAQNYSGLHAGTHAVQN